jgi:hypothetical protein
VEDVVTRNPRTVLYRLRGGIMKGITATCALLALTLTAGPIVAQPFSDGMEPLGPADSSLAPKVEASRTAAASWRPVAGVTLAMKAEADSLLARQLGRPLFEQLIVFDPVNTDSGAYQMRRYGVDTRVISYWVTVPGDPDAAASMAVLLNGRGEAISTFGAPDCGDDGSKCKFISHKTALQRARDAGVPEGIAPWRWRFAWEPGAGHHYVIVVVLDEHADYCECEDVVVDAVTGEVLGRFPSEYARGEDAPPADAED